MATPLENIIDLQHNLDRLHQAQEQLDGIPEWMQELDSQYQEQRQEIEELERESEEAASSRRAAEAGIADAQEKLKRYQQQINDVTNQREYGALLQEIDGMKTEIARLEAEGLEALETRETADKALEERRSEFQELQERYETELQKWESEKPEIRKEAEELEARVEATRGEVPRGVLAQFDRIYDRMNRQALAPVREIARHKGPLMWHCGVCNYNVRPNVVVEIRNNGGIVQCDSCKRILFVEEQDQASDEEE
jgi:predicted  nucleic acid-binding Zn-ribbon protein